MALMLSYFLLKAQKTDLLISSLMLTVLNRRLIPQDMQENRADF